MGNKCERGPTVNVGPYVVQPCRTDGQVVIDRRTKTSDGDNFFRVLRRDRFLALPTGANFRPADGSPAARQTFRALETYLTAWGQICQAEDPEFPAPPCDSPAAAIEEYVRNRGSNTVTPLTLPRRWKEHLTAMAKAAGGTLRTSTLDTLVRGLIRQTIRTTLPEFRTRHKVSARTYARLVRLSDLAKAWRDATPAGRPDPQLAKDLHALDALIESLAVQRID